MSSRNFTGGLADRRTAGLCRKRCSTWPARCASRSPPARGLANHRSMPSSVRSDQARPARDKRDPLRRRRAAQASTRQKEYARQRHRHRGHEGLRPGCIGRVDRFRSRDDERPRGRRRRRRSAPRAERRRRRSQHDGDRRGLRRARLPHVDQHLLPVLRLEGHAPDRRRASGAPGSDGGARRLAERRPRPGSDHAGDGRQLRDADQRRHAHGQRRLHDLRRPGAPEDHRRLLPAADALAHEVDHGRQPRTRSTCA